MNKKDAIDKTNHLLKLLENVPDGRDDIIDVLRIEFCDERKTAVQLHKGLESIIETFCVNPIEFFKDEKYKWIGFETEDIIIFQLFILEKQ